MAFVGGKLYAGERFGGGRLREINPLTGATLSTVTVTLPGFTVKGINGLSVHPDTGILLLEGASLLSLFQPQSGRQPHSAGT